jgi:hypothetical protein
LVAPAAGAFTQHTSGSAASFPQPVAAALKYVGTRTEVPIKGPTAIPEGLSARAQASAKQYSVTLYRCPDQDPLNSTEIGEPSCQGLAQLFGSFGGQRYGSVAGARRALVRAESSDALGCPKVRSLRSHDMRLSGGIVATVQSSGRSVCAVTWRDGTWSIELVGSLFGGPQEEAESVLGELDGHDLPRGSGQLLVDSAGDGEHTSTMWTEESDLYVASAYHSVTSAVSLASSM